jgi:hypothetical protein
LWHTTGSRDASGSADCSTSTIGRRREGGRRRCGTRRPRCCPPRYPVSTRREPRARSATMTRPCASSTTTTATSLAAFSAPTPMSSRSRPPPRGATSARSRTAPHSSSRAIRTIPMPRVSGRSSRAAVRSESRKGRHARAVAVEHRSSRGHQRPALAARAGVRAPLGGTSRDRNLLGELAEQGCAVSSKRAAVHAREGGRRGRRQPLDLPPRVGCVRPVVHRPLEAHAGL